MTGANVEFCEKGSLGRSDRVFPGSGWDGSSSSQAGTVPVKVPETDTFKVKTSVPRGDTQHMGTQPGCHMTSHI